MSFEERVTDERLEALDRISMEQCNGPFSRVRCVYGF